MNQEPKTTNRPKIRRSALILIVVVGLLIFDQLYSLSQKNSSPSATKTLGVSTTDYAKDVLNALPIKGRSPFTGYSRDEFGQGWMKTNGCDTRNIILTRDLTDITIGSDDCTVMSGILIDPYTGKTIEFHRGSDTSDDVQIDHVVALADAWQKGAQQIEYDTRVSLANDPLNLLAVDGPTNMAKSSSDAATWLPPNKSYRCLYVARQIAVKQRYSLWITRAEYNAMERVLKSCPEQRLPEGGFDAR